MMKKSLSMGSSYRKMGIDSAREEASFTLGAGQFGPTDVFLPFFEHFLKPASSVAIVLVSCVQRKCLLILVMPCGIWCVKMRLRVISSRNEISSLNPNEKAVHMAFRASNVDFLNLMQRCPRLRIIQVPPSYRKTMSNAIQVFLEMQGIDMLEGDVWGHRKDLDEYFTVDDGTLEEIRALVAGGASADEVADQIQKKARIGSELIKYIAKSKMTA
jgi:hypothetical protein